MGKIEAEAHISHFSHPHPLTLKSINSSPSNTTKCSACGKQASGLVYSCDSCTFSLHKICSQMPEKLNHRADPNHALTLLPSPAYPTGSFHCNACGAVGGSFCYHCGECELDLHPACAFTRSSVEGGAHRHPLHLCFAPPYEDRAFVCDVCGGTGSDHWLYRCEECEFDAHLKCGKADKVLIVRQPATVRKRMVRSESGGGGFPATNVYEQQEYWRHHHQHHQVRRYDSAPVHGWVQQQPGRNDVVQNVVSSVVEGLIEGAANQLGQVLLQGALGN